jgi:hypothetical protein
MAAARPARVRAAPAFLHDEQASHHEVAALLAQFRNPVAEPVPSSNSDEESDMDSGPEEGEERKESDRRPAAVVWSKEHMPVRPLAFSPPRRPAHPFDHYDTPIDFFTLIITDEFIDACVTYTNIYAQQRVDADKENPPASSHAAQWEDTTQEEIKALIGCLIFMGIVCMKDTRDYWTQATAQPFITSTFTRDRFLSLLSNLRVSDDESDEDDQLSKLRDMIRMLTAAIQKHFYPDGELTIDEAMILFKGRSNMRQHIAKKASPTGFKVWMLVDVESNYVYSFDIYTGKNKSKREEGATAAVVLKLIEPLTEHCWHRIGMDGFFTSVQLFEKLLSKGFYAVGTTRHNRRNFPKDLLKEVETCARGEYVWRQHGSMVCFSWMDKKPVNMLSTFNDPLEKSTVKRRTGKDLFDVSCPSVVPDYLRTMRGVDVFAQRQSYSKIGRRSKKWFYSLVWFMFDVAIHNAFILHQKKHKQQHYGEKDFRKQLMDQLVHGFTQRKQKGRHAPVPKRRRDSCHRVQHCKQQGTCVECLAKVGRGGHNVRSYWRCEDCDVHLCMPTCYNKHIQALAADVDMDE